MLGLAELYELEDISSEIRHSLASYDGPALLHSAGPFFFRNQLLTVRFYASAAGGQLPCGS